MGMASPAGRMPKLWTPALAVLVAMTLMSPCSAVMDRSEAFTGYAEGGGACLDKVSDCIERARSNGCIYDPFYMRQMCPQTCTVPQCTHRGAVRATHHGMATPAGTAAFQVIMNQQYILPDFSKFDSLRLSIMGIGTYLGDETERTNEAVVRAILYSVTHGWNVIDTASNYRWGWAETAVGRALDVMLAGDVAKQFRSQNLVPGESLQYKVASAVAADVPLEVAQKLSSAGGESTHQGADITRDMLFISTKVGFTHPVLLKQLLQAGALAPTDVVQGMHCLHPAYMHASLSQSLKRMRLQTVDLLYLHNAAEVQLPEVGREGFMKRLATAFDTMEEMRADGVIAYYGLATWECFRRPPVDPLYLALADVVALAQKAGGEQHGFKAIQVPLNADMTEAWLQPWQPLPLGREAKLGTLVEAARAFGVAIFGSGPLGEGSLLRPLEPFLDSVKEVSTLPSAAEKLLQLARSVPGVTTTLVGHKDEVHVEANVRVGFRSRLTEKAFYAAHHELTAARLHAQHATTSTAT